MHRPEVVPHEPDRRQTLAVVHEVRALAFAYHQRVTEAAQRAGVPVTDLRALVVLLDAERDARPVYAGDLARSLGMSSQATAALLRRLEGAGHVERRRDARDGRLVQIVVSRQALELGWQHFGPIVEDLATVVARLGPAERTHVGDVLRRARQALEGDRVAEA